MVPQSPSKQNTSKVRYQAKIHKVVYPTFRPVVAPRPSASDDRLTRATLLRTELEDKLSEWRLEVLRVQSESIALAEERARAATEARRARVASENRERARRHSAARAAAEEGEARRAAAAAERARDRGERARKVLAERQEELRRARLRAARMAELREGAVR